MNDQAVLLSAITAFLGEKFSVDRYPEREQGGVYYPSKRPVRRLGLALEPFSGLAGWIAANRPDALWLHRPWKLDLNALPPDTGIIYHHLPFDEYLTMGYNPRLAERLQVTGPLEPLGYKQDTSETGAPLPQRPIGMLFDAPPKPVSGWIGQLESLFGGYDQVDPGRQTVVGRVAVVGAMNDRLVREAANAGAGLYLTGQYRPSAQEAVTERGIAVVALGHRRTEAWGLQALADLLREQWPDLEVIVAGP
ncbi:Nif3-like dinuclear metal center hexameric protein [Spirosoma utsteinense]|uniref:NIF3 family GTP cyclohydrolase 1 type 2 n=1 Tax=Spirosoma utsteinense TaxID=2585773 RepID=A0ABR6W863_9BACT|nr:Nif3-like dinuclear metal center hexameric protein [Spirosoma utsteinense]MBC3786153.1 putative NIF3 family GTP cyclohydrolase 1 type 2 [Spirosoma utsteinense]MBC3792343.1 putative NIF3 family GTP cyclohydrolase 1 type 2 [Spirosoma utsteinense]